jgi:hypothetical protein
MEQVKDTVALVRDKTEVREKLGYDEKKNKEGRRLSQTAKAKRYILEAGRWKK